MVAIFDFYNSNKRNIDKLFFYGLFIVFVYFFVTVLFDYVAPFVIGLLLSVILEPLVDFFNRRLKIGRGILGMLCIILVIFLLGFAGTSIFLRIVKEAKAFIDTVPYYIGDVTTTINQLRGNYNYTLELVPDELRAAAEGIAPAAASTLTTGLSSFVRVFSTSFVRTVPNIFLGAILTLISMFFFIKDRPKIVRTFSAYVPPNIIRNYNSVKDGLFGALAGYIRAQAILMSISATICITGLAIIQYPFALFIGLLIAFVDALPIFGSGFVLWPWAFFSAVTGDVKQAVALMIIYAVIIVTRQSLEPKVLGSQIGVHPLITLMSMFIGLKVFGVLGFFIGPFIVVTIKALESAEAS